MRTLFLSDLHESHSYDVFEFFGNISNDPFKEFDLIVLAGDIFEEKNFESYIDISGQSRIYKDESFAKFVRHIFYNLAVMNDCPIIAMPGNHDPRYEIFARYVECTGKGQAIQEGYWKAPNGTVFWFSPYSKRIVDLELKKDNKNTRYSITEALAEEVYADIPQDVEVLVSHGPALNMLDSVGGEHIGLKALSSAVDRLPNLKYLITGHCHGDATSERRMLCKRPGLPDLTVMAASVLDDDYRIRSKSTCGCIIDL